jgi:hypothetical protein
MLNQNERMFFTISLAEYGDFGIFCVSEGMVLMTRESPTRLTGLPESELAAGQIQIP